MRVAVLGGGINGFSCALKLLEHFKAQRQTLEITVISEVFTPNTTGDGSAGLWGPYLLGGTPTDKVHKWSKGTHDFLKELWLSEDAGEAGVCLIPVARVNTKNEAAADDFWQDIVYGFAPLTAKQLAEFSKEREVKYTTGTQFVTYTSEPLKLLPYLMKRYAAQGGKIVQQKVENLENFISSTNYDVIVNCTGLGARQLINDQSMYPVRGQVSRIKANWLFQALLDDSDVCNYIIPNTETVVLGGTHQEHDYNTNVCKQDRAFILKGCQQIQPSIEHAQHLFDWVGLRPGRDELRLELVKQAGKIVIHNYGHGGSGVTLAWGCADEVLKLLTTELERKNVYKSKL